MVIFNNFSSPIRLNLKNLIGSEIMMNYFFILQS